MEFNFTLLVLAALAGMVTRLAVGWDPWKLLGLLTLALLLLPLLGLALENDPQVDLAKSYDSNREILCHSWLVNDSSSSPFTGLCAILLAIAPEETESSRVQML